MYHLLSLIISAHSQLFFKLEWNQSLHFQSEITTMLIRSHNQGLIDGAFTDVTIDTAARCMYMHSKARHTYTQCAYMDQWVTFICLWMRAPFSLWHLRMKGPECNAFFYTGIHEWNLLPNSIKCSNNHYQFKRAVKNTSLLSLIFKKKL